MAKIETVATLKTSNFKSKLDGMKSSAGKFKGGFVSSMKSAAGGIGLVVVAIGAAIIGFSKMILKGASMGSVLSDLAYQSDLNVESFQKFEDAAIKAGSSASKMSNALFRIQDAQGEVLKGDKLMTDAFKQFGLTAKDIAGLGTEEIITKIGESLGNTTNKAEKLNALGDIIGKKNAKVLKEALIIIGEGGTGAAHAVSQETAELLDTVEDIKLQIKTNIGRGWMKFSAGFIRIFMSQKQEVAFALKSLERRKKREEDIVALKIAGIKKIEAREAAAAKKLEDKKKAGIARIRKISGPGIVADSLIKIGGMIGAGANRPDAIRIAAKQLEIQEKMAAFLETISKKTEVKTGLA